MANSKATFNWSDPLLLDQQLTDDERMVRDAAAAYAGQAAASCDRGIPQRTYRSGDLSRDGRAGSSRPTIPEQYGGAGLNYVCYGLIAREIERVDSGYRSMMSVQSSLVMVPINEFGSEAQQKYLPKLATGEWIGCFGLRPNRTMAPTRQHDHPRAQRSWRLLARAPRCGSPTRRSPMFSSSGPRTTRSHPGFILERAWKGLSTGDQGQGWSARIDDW